MMLSANIVPAESRTERRNDAVGPVAESERIKVIDVLRGFALFGVLLINMRNFDFLDQIWTGLDRVALWPVLILGDSKFWTLFSFLFGLGFALQMQRAEKRGAHFLPLYARRLLILLLFGALHSILLYSGDILYDYAIVGFLLLVFRKQSDRTIVVLGLLCSLIPMGRYVIRVRHDEIQRSNPGAARLAAQTRAEGRREGELSQQVYTRGRFADVAAYRARHFVSRRMSLENCLFQLGGVFPLFLLGLLAGRHRIFQNIGEYLPFIRRAFWWALALGLVATTISVTGNWPNTTLPYDTESPLWRGLLWYVGTPALSYSYASLLILQSQKKPSQAWLSPLAPVGRMALSNYLLQSLVFSTIFQGYALGMFGKIGPSLDVALTTTIYGLQLLLSVWWLRHFRFGPAEWLWRTLTYGCAQPMRVAARA